jgi:hypothetical protein
MIQAGLPVCIVVLLAEVRTLKGDKGMHNKKEMLGIRIPYLVCIPHVESCLCYFIEEQRPHTPLEVVAHLSYCLATPVGFTLFACGLGPHS